MELKNRAVIVSRKNMEALTSLYGRCSMDELERIVNNMIDNAVEEIREDAMGKIEVNDTAETSPEWCPLRCKK